MRVDPKNTFGVNLVKGSVVLTLYLAADIQTYIPNNNFFQFRVHYNKYFHQHSKSIFLRTLNFLYTNNSRTMCETSKESKPYF